MNEIVKIKARDLKKVETSCRYRRVHNALNLETEKGNAYYKAIAVTNVVQDALVNRLSSESSLIGRLEEEYSKYDMSFMTNHTKMLDIQETAKLLNRYLVCENRNNSFHKPFSKEIPIDFEDGTILMTVAPQLLFYSEEAKTIEVVFLKNKKPDISMRAGDEDLQLYAGILYARSLVPYNQTYYLRSSYYFLKKKNDTEEKFDMDFFNVKGAGNVVTMTDFWSNDGTKAINSLDDMMRKRYHTILEGIDYKSDSRNEAKCAECSLYSACYYKLPPVPFKEGEKKRGGSVKLTASQTKVVNHRTGESRVNAGPGSGKTVTVAERVVELMEEPDVKPWEILLITFTEAGAEEMRTRVEAYAEARGWTIKQIEAMRRHLKCYTFNAFGNEIIKKNFVEMGFTGVPVIIDNVEESALLTKILTSEAADTLELDYKNFDMNMKNAKGLLEKARIAFCSIKENEKARKLISSGEYDAAAKFLRDVLGSDTRFFSYEKKTLEKLCKLFPVYEKMMVNNNFITYTDQEVFTIDFLSKNQEYINKKLAFKHIIIDEFQDTSARQMTIIKLLKTNPNYKSLLVVGDDSQGIFGFRGGTPENIVNFQHMIAAENIADYYLSDNFRSTPEIVDLANKVNERNHMRVKKTMVSGRASIGIAPKVKGFYSKVEEYKYIASYIKHYLQLGYRPEDLAFIAFKRTELMEMADILTSIGIPSCMRNPEPIFENPRVKALISLGTFFKNPVNKQDAFIFLNAVEDGHLLEKQPDDQVNMMVENLEKNIYVLEGMDTKSKKDMFIAICENLITSVEDEIFDKFLEKVKSKETYEAMVDYLYAYSVYGARETMKREHNYPGVILTTAHSSKGLEWKVCFVSVTNFDEKKVRSSRAEMEERRRLLFVALTRAKDELHITGLFRSYGDIHNRIYNYLLEDIYKILGEVWDPVDPADLVKLEDIDNFLIRT